MPSLAHVIMKTSNQPLRRGFDLQYEEEEACTLQIIQRQGFVVLSFPLSHIHHDQFTYSSSRLHFYPASNLRLLWFSDASY